MPEKFEVWIYVLGAVAVAVLANYLAAMWGSREDKWSFLLLAIVLISPIVFITFGLVTARVGVAIGSGTIDSLLTISTVLLGLVVFAEWNRLAITQYIGLLLVLGGILLMHVSFSSES